MTVPRRPATILAVRLAGALLACLPLLLLIP